MIKRLFSFQHVLAALAMLFSLSLYGQVMDYTYTLNDVNVIYDGVNYSNKDLTFKFLNVDSSRVQIETNHIQILFPNGVDVLVTLEDVFTEQTLDNQTSNGLTLVR